MSTLTTHVARVAVASLMLGCGGSPPPQVEEPVKEPVTRAPRSGSTPQVSQELGSIDSRKVEQTFATLQRGALEVCHTQGRDRVDLLAGDVKVFLRIDGSGRVRYGYFEESTLGDRDVEKCILRAFSNATWPKPEGGEAEVRSGFGWSAGDEHEPTAWPSVKVTLALTEQKDVRKNVDQCKSGVHGEFRVTAYVESEEVETDERAKRGKNKPLKNNAPAHPKKSTEKAIRGKFKTIGVAVPSKEGAEKIDCIVEALRPLELPNPGSYPAKVSFTL